MNKEVAIFVLWDEDTKTALMENRPEYNDGEEYWVYPGGKLEEWETPEQAMLRECYEEIGYRPLNWMENVTTVSGDNGWTCHVFQVAPCPPIAEVPSTTDRGAPLRWISPGDIVQLAPGPTARLAIAQRLQVDCEVCGALVKQEYMRHIKAYLSSFSAEQRMRVQSRYSFVPYLACPNCFLPLASYANGITDRPRVVLEK